jgi:hypothetical protein
MFFAAVSNLRDLIEVFVVGVSVLGGLMAFFSGHAAAEAASKDVSAEVLAERINLGLADGFLVGLPCAGIVSILLTLS